MVHAKTPSSTNACAWADDLRPTSIAVVGDLQRTSDAEKIFLSRSDNHRERSMILDKIAEEKPDMLLLLGDQVGTGDADSDWTYFDNVMGKVKDAKIPVRAIYGNHDYGYDKGRCIRNFSERFPHQAEHGASMVKLGHIALVTVDTNFDQLSPSEIDRQVTKYRKWIGDLEDDPEVKGVIVAAHHAPYTNSELGANPIVISMFAEPFYNARKTRLFLSGHVHNYERFVTGDKMFVVTGGGGGPLRSVDTSSGRRFQNDGYRSKAVIRPFHYMKLTVDDASLKAETKFIVKNGFKSGDNFSLGLYNHGTR
ncbi:MAG: metallophosphoesterase [bacterium]|nr:metallophosphoesterase [Candidatus Kapabacteria bacterium]